MTLRNPNRTRILATLGPATDSLAAVHDLLRAGADAFRINMSHGAAAGRARLIGFVQQARMELDLPVSIVADLRGPRLRLASVPEGSRRLKRGESVTVVAGARAGAGELAIDYPRLVQDLAPKKRILLRDGRAELVVKSISGRRILCTVRRGAEVSSNQGVNLPDSHLSAPLLAARDRRDIEFAVKHGVDWLAVSFVRGPEDLREVRKAVKKAGGDLLLIAKIELPVAVKRLDEILDEADAVMVARGDLAVEMGHEVVPTIQKRIIQRAIETARPVITATEMLESMIANAQPTRAEVSDVANAVIDGTDAVMLSGETAVGAFPVETVRTMHRIVARTETELFGTHARPRRRRTADFRCDTPERAIVLAAVTAADIGQARVVVAFTESGRTARLVSSFRSAMPVMGLTSREASFHRMALYWGVRPVLMRSVDSVSSMYREGVRVLSKAKWLKTGDLVAALTGTFAVSGATNTLRLMPFAELGLVADSKPRRNK